MPVPALTRKHSSIAALIELERQASGPKPTPTDEETSQQQQQPEAMPTTSRSTNLEDEGGDTDIEGGDTDIELEDEPPAPLAPVLSKQKLSSVREDIASPPRMSRRLMSMKRRGKLQPLVEFQEEFEFFAGDFLTVRGEGEDFYVCRVLEDVLETAEVFQVAWYNRIEENVYEPSFDDICNMMSVITRVALIEPEDGTFSLSKKHIKQTKKLLREALMTERGEEILEEDDDEEDEIEEEEDEEEEQPPAKRTRRSTSGTTPSPKKGRKGKAATPKAAAPRKRKGVAPKAKKEKKPKPEKKAKPRRTGVLIPNPGIELLDKDPTFESREDLGLMPCKQAIRAIFLDDLDMLKEAIENIKEVYTVHWPRSVNTDKYAIHYALMNGNKDAIKLLLDDITKPKKNRCGPPKIALSEMDTGSYNFYTFGHAVREIYASRGSREGNNAFLHDKKKSSKENSLKKFCLKTPLPLDIVQFFVEEMAVKSDKHNMSEFYNAIWVAIRAGNRKVAGYLVAKAVEDDGFGFNFLHKEVLVNEKEPLSKFRSPSAKKKPYENKCILPIHAACINPNGQYIKQLLNSVPEHNIPDKDGYKPVHYAAACEGPEPLKVLLARGVDPSDLAPKGVTPLMIAAKHGRHKNIALLLTSAAAAPDEAEDDEEADIASGATLNVNAKSKKTKCAIHFAASHGHIESVRVLVSHGASIDAQTGSYQGNVTPLMLGAMRGNLQLVKTCVELGATADKKGKWNMTALMYAVKNGHSPVAAYLLRLGVNPNASDTSGNTPAHYAAAYGWLHCLEMLIKAGADPNTPNQWKTTPLAVAMMKDHMKCAEFLLNLNNCDVNFQDDKGRTLLSQTLQMDKIGGSLLKRLKFLVEEKSANVNLSDVDNWTPLHYLVASSIYKSDESVTLRKWLGIEKEPDQTSDDGDEGDAMSGDDDADDDTGDDDEGGDDDVGDDDEGEGVIAEEHSPTPPPDEDPMDVDKPAEDDGNESDDSEVDYEDKGSRWIQKCISTPPRLVMSRARAACVAVEVLVKAGADINALNTKGETPLMIAVLQHNFPLVRKLLELGAKPSEGKNLEGQQVVHLLVHESSRTLDLRRYYPDEKEAQLKGTESEQKEQREKFLKSQTVRATSESLGLLISADAHLCAADNHGITPLMAALKAGNHDLFEILLSHKVDPAIGLENTGRNLLHMMSDSCLSLSMPRLAKKVTSMLDKSVKHRMANTVDNSGFTPLLEACEKYANGPSSSSQEGEKAGREFIEVLIDEFGADVKCQVGKVTRGAKVVRRSPHSIGLTVKRKEGEKEEDDEYGVTGKFSCLHFLANYQRVDPETSDCISVPCLQLLLLRLSGCHDILNSRDRHGRTALHLAVRWNKKHAVEALIKSGVDLNLKSGNNDDDFCGTALILAAKPSQKLDIVNCLLDAKADPNLTDSNQRTALSYAVSNAPDSTASVLKLVEALLTAGAHVNSVDKSSRSPLHYAVNTTTGGFETLTEVENHLIQHGADTAALDIRGRIPLHYAFVKIGKHNDASLSDPVSISGLLVEAMSENASDMRALINTQDMFGQTALHRAAIRGATICCLNLLQKGSRMDIQDNDGNTAFSLAIRHNHNSCAMMFIQKNTPARCDVITPVTPEQLKEYEKEERISKWKWKEITNLKRPTAATMSAFRAVVERNWQGVAYLMLDVAGLDFIVALRAVLAARKMDLAWTLLRKQRKDSSVQGTDDHGRTLLHLLAIHCTTFGDVESKIAVHLLQRGVSPSALNKEGALALHYAAVNGNKGLCELLLRYNPSTINTADPHGMTPLAGAFDVGSSDLESRLELIKVFVSGKPNTLDVCYGMIKGDADNMDSTTPLIEAALANSDKIVQLLLENGTNVDFPKANGRTALMEVVRADVESMAKVLLYGDTDRGAWTGTETNVNLQAKDNEGKTVVHHCVQNREYGSSEDTSMLRLLAKFGAPLTEPDNSGHDPLYYASQQGSGVMEKALRELIDNAAARKETQEPMVQELGFTFTSSRDAFWEGPDPDVDADAKAMLAEAKDADEEPEYDPTKPPPVDPAAVGQGTGEVYMDPTTGIPYDILMTKVDVKFGYYGLNNFYKMQVIYEKGKNLWVLLNRWGRIGDRGQHQRTPFSDPKEATEEFKKIFRSKTGNQWNDKNNFVKQPKKYSLVLPERNPEFKRRKTKEILKPFDLKACAPSRLPKALQRLMIDITDQEWLRKSVGLHQVNLDSAYMPFGRLSMETINQARDILLQIKEIQKDIDSSNLKGSEDKFDKIADLSNTYYMLLPMSNYAYEKIKPLNEESKVDQHLNALSNLTELALASKLLLAAQYRSKEINPLDYCYRALGTHVELMDHESAECQLLLEYIHNSADENDSHNKFNVEGIYRISREGEGQRMAACGVTDNHRLLWHGTRSSNVLGILKQGLRIAPPEAPSTGWSLGKGIYSSDSIHKAQQYTEIFHWRSRSKGFLLLCEVALGKQYEYGRHPADDDDNPQYPPEGYNSLWRPTRNTPNPHDNVATPYGALVPAGKWVTNNQLIEQYAKEKRYLQHGRDTEFVVYNEAQARQRYMVVVNTDVSATSRDDDQSQDSNDDDDDDDDEGDDDDNNDDENIE